MDAIIVGKQDYQSVSHDYLEKGLRNQQTIGRSHLPSQILRIKISEKDYKINPSTFPIIRNRHPEPWPDEDQAR